MNDAKRTVGDNPVATYLFRLLGPYLGYLVPDTAVGLVVRDVGRRLSSALRLWADEPTRRTLLAPWMETVCGFEPADTPVEVRALVACTIRNSLVEDLHAQHPWHPLLQGLGQTLSQAQIRRLTTDSAHYWSHVDLHAAGQQAPVSPETDPFADLPRRYPLAWHSLSLLDRPPGSPVPPPPAARPPDLGKPDPDRHGHTNFVLASGISPQFNPGLVRSLHTIALGLAPLLFSPSFPHISRHPRTLLGTIEYALSRGAPVVTYNSILTPHGAKRRTPALAPPEALADYDPRTGLDLSDPLGAQHAAALTLVAQSQSQQ